VTLDLEPIQKRAKWMQDNADQCQRSPGQVSLSGYVAACIDCGRDVPALVAEVERLRVVDLVALALIDPTVDAGQDVEVDHPALRLFEADNTLADIKRIRDELAGEL